MTKKTSKNHSVQIIFRNLFSDSSFKNSECSVTQTSLAPCQFEPGSQHKTVIYLQVIKVKRNALFFKISVPFHFIYRSLKSPNILIYVANKQKTCQTRVYINHYPPGTLQLPPTRSKPFNYEKDCIFQSEYRFEDAGRPFGASCEGSLLYCLFTPTFLASLLYSFHHIENQGVFLCHQIFTVKPNFRQFQTALCIILQFYVFFKTHASSGASIVSNGKVVKQYQNDFERFTKCNKNSKLLGSKWKNN